MKTKIELRQFAKETRKKLDIELISEKIVLNLKNTIEYQNACKILCYSSFDTEVITKSIIKDSSKQIYLPRVVKDILEVCLHDPSQMKVSNYGIHEPTNECLRDLSYLELIIVPGLAFTKEGIRLGYGKGFYDRLFATPTCCAKRIGLVPDSLLLDFIPCDPHDQKCDIIVTESRVINTKNI